LLPRVRLPAEALQLGASATSTPSSSSTTRPASTCFGASNIAAPFSGSGNFQVVDLLSFAGVDPASFGQ
jgi:hypothetical protein